MLDLIKLRFAFLLLGCALLLGACAERTPPAAEPAATAAPTPAGFYIVVERGQSLDSIARTYRVAKGEIVAANKLMPPYGLKPGTVLQIPRAAASPAKQTTTRPKPAAAEAKPGRSAKTAAPAPQSGRPKRSPPEVIPLD
jgi:LysM repeat protein